MTGGRDIEFGLFLTNQHPPGADLVAATEDQLRLVRAVRDLGWDSIWAGQHYLPDGMAMPQCAPFLARITAESGNMRVGIGILLLALHNPLDVAETWASLDVLAGGRLVFGVGLGYREVEYAAFGLDPRWKVRRFEANLDIVARLWAGEAVDADLAWCKLDGARLNVLPVQRPRPPIWIAANAHAAVERAARLGDAWLINPHATAETIAGQVGVFRSARAAAGLDVFDFASQQDHHSHDHRQQEQSLHDRQRNQSRAEITARRYPRGRRCPSAWWAPPPSKRAGRAIPVRRVRFPSTSANRGVGRFGPGERAGHRTGLDGCSGRRAGSCHLGRARREPGRYLGGLPKLIGRRVVVVVPDHLEHLAGDLVGVGEAVKQLRPPLVHRDGRLNPIGPVDVLAEIQQGSRYLEQVLIEAHDDGHIA